MSRQTLDALLEAIREYLPQFRAYLKHKASLLGHENGLPSTTYLHQSEKAHVVSQSKSLKNSY